MGRRIRGGARSMSHEEVSGRGIGQEIDSR